MAGTTKFGAWAQTNLGSAVLGGLIVLAVGVAASRATQNIPLGTLVVVMGIAAASTALFLSVANSRWRDHTWSWLGRLRITTRRQRQALVDAGYRTRDEEQRVVDADAALRAAGMRDDAEKFIKEVASRPRLPLPLPRWSLRRVDGDDQFLCVLANSVDRSVAREVRLECSNFDFFDGAQWADVSGDTSRSFRGSIKADRYTTAVSFEVEWYDETGLKRTEQIWLSTSWAPF